MSLKQRYLAFWCRTFGHVWARPKGSELKHCRRCLKVAPIKRRKVS